MSTVNPDTIISAVDASRKNAATKPLDVSLNELADMYTKGELHIRPEYQRYFRWPRSKQSQFMESLLLEMPVPPLFIIELEEGRWELIDGLQRISSYLHFRGLLKTPTPPEGVESSSDTGGLFGDDAFLELEGCDIVEALNGLKFDDLPTALQIRLKRSFLRVEVIRHGSNPKLQYHMFKRLNTGGELLSDQEVRNCTIRLLGDRFNEFLIRLSKEVESFNVCTEGLTEEAISKRQREELVLRFFAFKNNFAAFRYDISPFLTDYMERVTDTASAESLPFDYVEEESVFKRTFDLLAETLEANACRAFRGSGFTGGFSMHHFEAFSLGVARVVDRVRVGDRVQTGRIRDSLSALKRDAGFQKEATGGGKNHPTAYERKITAVAKAVEGAL